MHLRFGCEFEEQQQLGHRTTVAKALGTNLYLVNSDKESNQHNTGQKQEKGRQKKTKDKTSQAKK
jgi:hypothetical protein